MMKDCTTCKYGFVDEQLGFPMCHHPSRFSEDCVDFNMHEEIEEPKKATGIEEKKLPAGLEEAADKYAYSIYPSEGVANIEIYNAFIAGAKWGMNQCPLPEDTIIFLKGVAEGKRLMMEEAVECVVVDFSSFLPRPQVDILLDAGKYHSGDKVKVIVLKAEEE